LHYSAFGPSYIEAFHEGGMEAVKDSRASREARKRHLDTTLAILYNRKF
jgi:hypothetical protein